MSVKAKRVGDMCGGEACKQAARREESALRMEEVTREKVLGVESARAVERAVRRAEVRRETTW
jgi:hypothetical protein